MTPQPEQLCESVTLYEGDCLDVLPTLEAGSVDAVITDPPYGDVTHEGARSNRSQDTRDSSDFIDFESVSPEYVRSVFSLCKPARWLVSFLDWHHVGFLESNPPDGLKFVRFGVWVKPNAMPQLTKDRPGTGWEAVAILHANGTRMQWNRGSESGVWTYGTSRWGYFGPSNHPTEKPLPLVQALTRDFTNPGDTILDPFAGSGTTGVAALLEGRKAILIEKDPRYCEVIRKRIQHAAGNLPGSLFEKVKYEPNLFATRG